MILQKLKSVHPDIFICLCTIYITDGNLDTTNTVIYKIAEKYGCPVIDNRDLRNCYLWTDSEGIHTDENGIHLGKAGNIYVANRVFKTINNYLSEDIKRCEFVVHEK